jgi:hypothetical protein
VSNLPPRATHDPGHPSEVGAYTDDIGPGGTALQAGAITMVTPEKVPSATASDLARRDPDPVPGPLQRLVAVPLALLLIALAALAVNLAGATSLPDRRIAVYGDSIIWEAQAALQTYAGPGIDLTVSAAGGAALCDLAEEIARAATSGATDLLVIGFTGNVFTPCTQRNGPPVTRDDVRALYEADLDTLLARVRPAGVPVLLVGAPPGRALDGTTLWPPVNDAWREAAQRWAGRGMDIAYADAGTVLADPGGDWTPTMECLAIEGVVQGCEDGQIPVRAPDSVHLCPEVVSATEGVVPRCSVWSAGAWRYAQGIMEAAEQSLDRHSAAPD